MSDTTERPTTMDQKRNLADLILEQRDEITRLKAERDELKYALELICSYPDVQNFVGSVIYGRCADALEKSGGG